MKPLTHPQISLNGTSRDALVKQQCDVMRALDAAYTAMNEAAPNGRDYQYRPFEFKPAREAWNERMQIIRDMRNEIEAHAVAIQDGGK